MYSTLLRLYISGKLSLQGLNNAVFEGWIKEEQKEEILNSK